METRICNKKTCTHKGKAQSLEEFPPRSGRQEGELHTTCRTCRRAYMAEYRARQKAAGKLPARRQPKKSAHTEAELSQSWPIHVFSRVLIEPVMGASWPREDYA